MPGSLHHPDVPPRFRLEPPRTEDVQTMTALAHTIEEMVRSGDDPEDAPALEAALAAWNERANRRFEPDDFRAYHDAMTIASLVERALRPAAVFVVDLTYDEARGLLAAVTSATLAPSAHDHYLSLLDANLPGASLSDLIYWPNLWFEAPDAAPFELSVEHVLAYAMQRAKRPLPGAPATVSLPRRDPKSR